MKKIFISMLFILFSASLCAKENQLYFSTNRKIKYPAKIENSSKLEWLQVKVPTNKGNFRIFKIMSRPVTQEEFFGYGNNESISEIDFNIANSFCMEKFGAMPSNIYVFEYARQNLKFNFSKTVNLEMISPVDYEDIDEIFYMKGDKLEKEDGFSLIIFNHKKKIYIPKSIRKRLNKTTFRCYKP